MVSPKVSIIIPTYNHEHYILTALKSCFLQIYKNIEIIIIDDGSTDNTKNILSSYLNRVTYLYQENQGLAAARNTGLNTAEGKYIQFLDSDDTIHPEKLSKQVNFLEQNKNCIAVFCNCGKSDFKYKEYFTTNPIISPTKYLIYYNFIPVHTMLSRRNNFRFNTKRTSLEDWEYWLNVCYNRKIGYSNETLCEINRTHSDNMSSNMLRMTINEIQIRLSLLNSKKYSKYWGSILTKLLLNIFGGIPAGVLQKLKKKYS
jgi:glycosyltransferase involved in cell wall biosynthesis